MIVTTEMQYSIMTKLQRYFRTKFYYHSHIFSFSASFFYIFLCKAYRLIPVVQSSNMRSTATTFVLVDKLWTTWTTNRPYRNDRQYSSYTRRRQNDKSFTTVPSVNIYPDKICTLSRLILNARSCDSSIYGRYVVL